MLSRLEAIALILALLHFSVPLAYYLYLKRMWLDRPQNIRIDYGFRPAVSIVVPTYNEAYLIERKLDNIYSQDYPKDRVEIVVVDSSSSDGTAERVLAWASKHPDASLRVVVEPDRGGKGRALNTALKSLSGDVVVITDADSAWTAPNTLRRAVELLSDPSIGAVSCVKAPIGPGATDLENSYRSYYNVVRAAESKAYSTPIFHGELAAFKRDLLDAVGGFPEDIGADDSHTATRIALMGYKAIVLDDLKCMELVPRRDYHMWRIRRAQHLVQHFLRTLKLAGRARGVFKAILYIEIYLHLANPILLPTAALLLIISALKGNIPALAILILGLALLAIKPYRTWVTTQIHLLVAMIRNIFTKELIWSKPRKT
ncbi:MAG: glycosyltransferase [Desulfurococcales archaeon]|nr:glycosyltransferase [Desulfurococcales archaeon]